MNSGYGAGDRYGNVAGGACSAGVVYVCDVCDWDGADERDGVFETA